MNSVVVDVVTETLSLSIVVRVPLLLTVCFGCNAPVFACIVDSLPRGYLLGVVLMEGSMRRGDM